MATDTAIEPPPLARARWPLKVPKASDLLVEELTSRITHGDFPVGTALPTERLLVSQTGLSRATVRDALKVLEVRGLVEIRTGRAGGAFVRRLTGETVAASVRLVVRAAPVRMVDLLQTRAAVEPACAALAATRRTDVQLRGLDAINAQMAGSADVVRFLRTNVQWHMAIAAASGNELLSGFMQALFELIYDSTGHSGRVDVSVRAQTHHAHTAITDGVRAGDVALARRRMERHVRAYLDAVVSETTVSLDWTGVHHA